MTTNIKHCREHFYSAISVYSETILPFLGALTLLSFLPAFLYGCSAPEPLLYPAGEVCINIDLTKGAGNVDELDIFVFRNDRLQKTDCYQKVPDLESWNREVVSGYGDRIIAVCANCRKDIMEWTGVSSFPYLQNLSVSLEDDDPESPFMSGWKEVSAGSEGRHIQMQLSPLTSIVRLQSISCDFSGRPYSGEKMTDVRIYLTNVSAECRLFDEKGIMPIRVVNAGGLCEDDMEAFRDASVLYRELPYDIGSETIRPDISLICYPNNSPSESPGTPFTRLVIEGKVGGQTYYWPIDINRDDGGEGIARNEKYIYDIRIRRKGTLDPDTPARTEDMDISFKIEKWEEQEDYKVTF